MKKIFVFIFTAATLFSASGFAQGGKQNMEVMKQRLKDSLKLSDVQVDSVASIMQEFQPQIKSIMKDETLSKDQKKEKIKPLRQQMASRLKTFLNEEQLGKLEQMQQEMKKNNKNQTKDG